MRIGLVSGLIGTYHLKIDNSIAYRSFYFKPQVFALQFEKLLFLN